MLYTITRYRDTTEARVYAYYGCEGEAHLIMPKKVA
jgi:hypothetical protein